MPADPLQTHVAQQLKHDAALISCKFDTTGKYIFAGGQDNLVLRWDLATEAKTVFAAHDSWVRSLGFSPSGDVLVTGGYDGRLILWPAVAEQPTPLKVIDAHAGWIRGLAISPNGQYIATAGNDHKVKLWQLADGAFVKEFLGHERHVYHVAFHPDGTRLVSGDLTAKFIDWDIAAGTAVRDFKIESLSKFDAGFAADYGGPHCLAFTPDGKRLLAGGITNVSNAFAGIGNPIISSIDWEQGKEVVAQQLKANPNGKTWGLAWHPEGFVIGATGNNAGGFVGFWKLDEKQEFHAINLGSYIRDLTLHPDGIRLGSPHQDGICRISKMAAKA